MKSWHIFIFLFWLPLSLVAQTTTDFGQNSRVALPSSYIKALVWNIHAGAHEDFNHEFKKLSRNMHLGLFQEVDLNDSLESALLMADLAYTHARSYISPISGDKKGVAIGSVSPAQLTRALRSPVSEFGVATPKAVLLQTFKLENRKEELLVVNVHAINFVTNKMFYSHIDQILKAIKSHKGPMLIAGDFNTWNDQRLTYLDRQMSKQLIARAHLGRGRSQFPDIGRWFGVQTGGAFDQVYTRGVKLRFAEVHAWANSSDHKPIEIHFSIL